MQVRFYGVRGSCPSPGESTNHFGGNTSCVAARIDRETLIIFDAGTGLRILGNEMMVEGWEGPIHLLLTHTHWDHIIGLPFFGPLWRPDTKLIIHPLTNDEQERFRWRPTLFDEIHFPVPAADIPCTIELASHRTNEWTIGSATVRRIRLNHPGGAQGFRVDTQDGASFAYLTDNEISPPGEVTTSLDKLIEFARGAEVIVHDTQYLEADMPAKRGWGHSTLLDVLRFGEQTRPKKLILSHHDPERHDQALLEIEEEAQAWLDAQAPGTEAIVAREGLTLDLPLKD